VYGIIEYIRVFHELEKLKKVFYFVALQSAVWTTAVGMTMAWSSSLPNA